jgi:hypothetical protein
LHNCSVVRYNSITYHYYTIKPGLASACNDAIYNLIIIIMGKRKVKKKSSVVRAEASYNNNAALLLSSSSPAFQ